ncbi:hypothetical protein [Flavobacterium subsaxonicum]|uniref:Uncharacterized protein n=1 Tax=Flavobacterium subsaxonicum WB 4.1-42 = DSM 21790 TaxID=1121898 RepID=A0A0A2MIL2_9FLAO|nr:hypothetical protein [Flavobacterium subsaxonicum]KGO92124.1 hypothetical protein Q766_14640 [Flavobacterium subsaxonicum WB 4.1-42 = DSM 21790]
MYKDFSRDIYIVFSNDELLVDSIRAGSDVLLNLGRPDSLKVPEYFKDNKPECISNVITSYSDHPNKLLSSLLHLLQVNSRLIVGTAGLSKDSIVEIINYLKTLSGVGKQIIFIHTTHQDKSISSDLKQITDQNIDQIVELL